MKTVKLFRAAIAAAVMLCFGVVYGSPASAQETAVVTLLHGIPGVPVDVAVDGTVLISNFESGKTENLSKYAGQTLKSVEVRKAGTTDVVIGPMDLLVPATGNSTVVAHFDAAGVPKLSVFTNDMTQTEAGKGRLTVVHAAAAPGVDLVVGDQRPIVNLENGASKALSLPAGDISGAKLAPTGGEPIVDVPTVPLAAGNNVVVYAVGSAKDSSLAFYTQTFDVGQATVESSTTTSSTSSTSTTTTTPPTSTSSTSTTIAESTSTSSSTSSTSTSTSVPTSVPTTKDATVTLLHGIPGVAVDVLVDGTVVFSNFEGGQTKDLSSFAGQTLKKLEVRPAGGTDPVIGPVDFEVPDSGNWTAVAHLDAAGKPTLSTFENDTTKTETGYGRLVVVHAAAAPAVDLVLGEERPIVNLANGSVKTLVLKAGTVSGAKLAPTGGDPVVNVPTVEVEAGKDLIVYAVGSLANSTVTFYTQTVDVGQTTANSSTTSTTIATQVRPVTGSGRTLWVLAAVLLATGLMLATAARHGMRTSETASGE